MSETNNPRKYKEHLDLFTGDERSVFGDEHGVTIFARGMSVDVPFGDAYSCEEIRKLAAWLNRYADWHQKTHQTWIDWQE